LHESVSRSTLVVVTRAAVPAEENDSPISRDRTVRDWLEYAFARFRSHFGDTDEFRVPHETMSVARVCRLWWAPTAVIGIGAGVTLLLCATNAMVAISNLVAGNPAAALETVTASLGTGPMTYVVFGSATLASTIGAVAVGATVAAHLEVRRETSDNWSGQRRQVDINWEQAEIDWALSSDLDGPPAPTPIPSAEPTVRQVSNGWTL
jgi:hypothetical protein